MKPTMLMAWGLLFMTAGLTSCSVVPTQFGGSWPLPVERQSSPAVDLARPALWPQAGGRYTLVGYLVRQYRGPTTANSHIDVLFLSADGKLLRQQAVAFRPQELKYNEGRRIPRASYELKLDALPVGTARIRVEAHDQPHA